MKQGKGGLRRVARWFVFWFRKTGAVLSFQVSSGVVLMLGIVGGGIW